MIVISLTGEMAAISPFTVATVCLSISMTGLLGVSIIYGYTLKDLSTLEVSASLYRSVYSPESYYLDWKLLSTT